MLSFTGYNLLTEDRISWLKANTREVNSSHDTLAKHREPADIIDHFAKADPHPKKANTQWLVKRYHEGDFRQEDSPRITQALSDFEKHKKKLDKGDINQYKHLSDVEDAVAPHLGESGSNKEAKRQAKSEGAELVHSEPGLSVHKMKTHEAACQYGAGTKWCTASKNNPIMFDHYNKQGPLYVVQTGEGDKKSKHQFHFESGQFMNEKDRPEDLGKLIKKHTGLKNVEEFRGKHPAFDTPEGLIHHAENGELYPSNMSAIKYDAEQKKPVLQAHHLEKAYNNGLKGFNGAKVSSYYLASHPNTPSHLLDKFIDDGGGTPSLVAKHPNMSDHAFSMLKDTHYDDVVQNPKLTSNQLEVLAKGANQYDDRIAKHPNVSQERLGKYIRGEEGGTATKMAALTHPNARAEDLERAYRSDPGSHPALSVAPNTPEHILHKLAGSKHQFIADNARKNLEKRGIKHDG